MNPDEDFTAVSVQNTFPIDLKGCVGDDQHMKYLTFSPKQMSSSVKFISTQRTFIPSEAEVLNSLSTLGCTQSNDWKKSYNSKGNPPTCWCNCTLHFGNSEKQLCFSIFVSVILHHSLWTTFRIPFCLKLLGIRLVIRMTTVTYLQVFPLNWNTHTMKKPTSRNRRATEKNSQVHNCISSLIRVTYFLGRGG